MLCNNFPFTTFCDYIPYYFCIPVIQPRVIARSWRFIYVPYVLWMFMYVCCGVYKTLAYINSVFRFTYSKWLSKVHLALCILLSRSPEFVAFLPPPPLINQNFIVATSSRSPSGQSGYSFPLNFVRRFPCSIIGTIFDPARISIRPSS